MLVCHEIGININILHLLQAAIGPLALDLARTSGNKEFEDLGLQVLTLAVLSILLTAPLGELAVILSGPRFLTKQHN